MNAQTIHQIALYMGIAKPFEIRIKSKEHKWAVGFCSQHTRKGKIVKHVITVYLPGVTTGNDGGLDTVIAHELIHAWQAEQGTLTEGNYHGIEFQEMADDISESFGISNIFRAGVDVD